MTELIWDGKYKNNKKQGPVRIALPFQTIETVNERAQDRRRNLELFATGRDSEWRMDRRGNEFSLHETEIISIQGNNTAYGTS